jgi:hypothetical protein
MFKDGRRNVHNEEQSDRSSVVRDDYIQSVQQIFVKDGAAQFQNFCVNFHKLHVLFSTKLSQLGYAITSFAQDGFQKCSGVYTKYRERLGFDFF